MTTPRYIILGTGLLGWALDQTLASASVPHISLSHDSIDRLGGLAAAAKSHVRAGDILVNAAALTQVDACESQPDKAFAINGEAPGQLAKCCADAGATFVHISTDAVLDVTNVYAKSKARGEAAVIEAVGEAGALVLRTSTNFGPHPTRTDFVRWVLGKLDAGEPFSVIDDMISSPTYVIDAARAITQLVAAHVTGVQQFVNHPGISRHAFACEIQTIWGKSGSIEPVPMSSFHGFVAPRPRDTSMTSTVDAIVKPMSLTACLNDYRARLSAHSGE